MARIFNGADIPLNQNKGTIPDVLGALSDYWQEIMFSQVTKSVVNFQLKETMNEIKFIGIIMPFSGRQLELLPIGERVWNWVSIFSLCQLPVKPDDVVNYLGKQ